MLGDVPTAKKLFKFENVWFEVEGFPDLVKGWCNELDVGDSQSFFGRKIEFFEIETKRIKQRCFLGIWRVK